VSIYTLVKGNALTQRDRHTTFTTRDVILDAAASVMHTLGLGRATTKEIAQAAGLSEAALYRHFEDKAELFLCVIGERLPQLIALLKDLPSRAGQRTVRANLEEIGRVALPFYEQTLPIASALFAEPDLLARHQEELRAKNAGPHRAVEMLSTYVRAEQRLGRINQRVDPEAVASLVVGSCLGRALVRRFTGAQDSPEADERFVRAIARTLMIGLAPEDRP
jgi:AcrR family transcriptional regulator